MSNMTPPLRSGEDLDGDRMLGEIHALAYGWNQRGRWDDAAMILRSARPLAVEQSAAAEARVLTDLIRVLNGQDFLQSVRNGAEVEALMDDLEAYVAAEADERAKGDLLHERAVFLHLRYFSDGGDPDRERDLLDAAIANRQAGGDRWGEGMSVFYRGCFDHVINVDVEAAAPRFERAYAIGVEIEAPLVCSYAARHLGQIDQQRGDLDAALRRLVESVELRESAGWHAGLGPALIALAEIHRVRGERESALEDLRQARVVALELDSPFLLEIAATEYDALARGSTAGGANIRVVVGPNSEPAAVG
jgi:tetratricopeptide (TPR) repeat protein